MAKVELIRQHIQSGRYDPAYYDTDEKILFRLQDSADDNCRFGWRAVSADNLIRGKIEHHPTNEHRPGYDLQTCYARITEKKVEIIDQ